MGANSVQFPGFLWTLLALMVVIPCSVKPNWWEYRAWGFNLTVWEHRNVFACLSCTRQHLLEKAVAAWLGLWNKAFNVLIAY